MYINFYQSHICYSYFFTFLNPNSKKLVCYLSLSICCPPHLFQLGSCFCSFFYTNDLTLPIADFASKHSSLFFLVTKQESNRNQNKGKKFNTIKIQFVSHNLNLCTLSYFNQKRNYSTRIYLCSPTKTIYFQKIYVTFQPLSLILYKIC